MSASSALTDALLAAGAVAIFVCGLFFAFYRLVVAARRRRKRAYVAAAALAPFMALGNVADPDFRIVQEAKRLKNREDDDPGDPPEREDDALPERASLPTSAAKPVAPRPPRLTKGARRPPRAPIRPLLVWAISGALGAAAVSTSLLLSWLLLSDPTALAPPARHARESLSVFEWSALYVMSATLLTSMIQLFRLRKSSLRVFGGYLTLGVVGCLWFVLAPQERAYFDVRVTLFAGVPAAIAVLAYMVRLRRRAVLS